MKKAAVIHDLSGFGKCSLTAAIPVLSALGVQCCPVATAVLTGQTGYPCYHCTDLTAMLPDYIDAWGKNNAHFDAIYSGFLTGAKQISQVLDFIPSFIILLPLQMEFTGTNRRFLTGVFPEPGICLPLYCAAAAQRAYARKMRFCLPGNFYPTVSGIP